MKSNENDKMILAGLEYLDDDIISDVLGKVDTKKNAAVKMKKRSLTAWKAVAALAACLALLTIVIPTSTLIVDIAELFAPVKESNATEGVNSAPEYDGSHGLLYVVNEDGETASFIGFGTCTDEVVYIASHFNGLPVVEMRNQSYADAEYIASDSNFGSKYAERIIVSDTVELTWDSVFKVCPNLESIYFGANVDFVIPFVFNGTDGMNFSTIEVSPDNKNYSSKGNCLVDLRTKELVIGTPTTVIPDDGSVEIIGFKAFTNARYGLTSIVIPEGVKIIDHGAFMACDKLESITLPDSLEVIEINAFSGCRSLEKLEIGNGLKSFNQSAFHTMYVPEIYYQGTVAEWEAVAKTRSSNYSLSIRVICTDGESLSNVGNQEYYNWIIMPEYRAYLEIHYPNAVLPDDQTE